METHKEILIKAPLLMDKIKDYFENTKSLLVLNFENTLFSLIIMELGTNYWSKWLWGTVIREVCYLKFTYALEFFNKI